MSVMTWGENPNGIWTLTVADSVNINIDGIFVNILHFINTMCFQSDAHGNYTGDVGQIWLTVHGTQVMPEYMSQGPRVYNKKYNNLRNKIDKAKADYKPSETFDVNDMKNSIYRLYDYY